MYVNVTPAQFAWLKEEYAKDMTSARIAEIRDNMIKWSSENGGDYDYPRLCRDRLTCDIRVIQP